jgi:hypothetical protein
MFVDFMYAIVVGSALPLLNDKHLDLSDVPFWGILFLLIVILEDYFLYETQIAPFQKPGKVNPIALFFEVAILVSWYFSALAVSVGATRTIWFLCAFGGFFLLKFLAGVTHWTGFFWSLGDFRFPRSLLKGLWESTVTNFAFWISILTVLGILLRSEQAELGWQMLLTLLIAWVFTLIVWWSGRIWIPINIVTKSGLPGATATQGYGPISLVVTRAKLPCVWSLKAGTLPTGLLLDPTGQISGTPTAQQSSAFTLEVRDAAAKTQHQAFQIAVT